MDILKEICSNEYRSYVQYSNYLILIASHLINTLIDNDEKPRFKT